MTSRGCDSLVSPWLQAWFTLWSQHFTLTTAIIKLELSLLSLRVKWSFLILLSCQQFTRGATPFSAYVYFGLSYCVCLFLDTIYWLLDFLKSLTLFSFLLHTLWLALQNTVPRSSPSKGRTITDLVFMSTYKNHGVQHKISKRTVSIFGLLDGNLTLVRSGKTKISRECLSHIVVFDSWHIYLAICMEQESLVTLLWFYNLRRKWAAMHGLALGAVSLFVQLTRGYMVKVPLWFWEDNVSLARWLNWWQYRLHVHPEMFILNYSDYTDN